MERVGGEDVADGDLPSESAIGPLRWLAIAALLALGLLLIAALAHSGDDREAGILSALGGRLPMLVSGLLAAASLAAAGYLLGALRSRLFPASSPAAASSLPAGENAQEMPFREQFAACPEGLALLDGDRVEAANPALEALAGVREGGLDGEDFAALVGETPDGEDGAETLPLNLDGVVRSREAGLRRRDDSWIPVEIDAYPCPWRGRALKLVEVRHIAGRRLREEARRREEEELRRSEAALRSLLAHSHLAFFAVDARGIFTLAEGRGIEALGFKSAELVGQSALPPEKAADAKAQQVKPSRLRALQASFRKAMEGRAVEEILEVSGSLFEVRLRPVAGPDGKPAGANGIAMDVTDLKRAEDDLRRGKEQLRAAISNAPILLFALDRKGAYTLMEGRVLEDLGLKAADALGKPASEVHRDVPQLAMNVRRALSGEEFASLIRIGGLWFETHYRPVFEGYDEVAGVIGVAINVTDRKRAEDALRRSEDQLRHSRKMEAIGRVAGGVAHDFNNLLTAITGYTELLLTDAAPGEPDTGPEHSRKSLEEIRKAAERATTLTRQLLAFSRRQVLTPKLLNLNQAVSDIDKMLRRLIREDIELVSMLDPALGDVWVDPGQMEQVILNLALNARDAMPRGGQLTLETANVDLESHTARGELFLVPGPYVMLAVSDTGMGMDEEVKAHLFEPFFTTKADGNGLGLGLSAVYGIVKQSGGTIAVESEKGRGTTFRVYLPRADKAAVARNGGRAPDSLHGEETVLLVEDEEAVRTLIREILAMHGYRVIEARSGGEAILASQRHDGPIHTLLTDVVMANMSGRELADHLRPLRPEMKILYISGYSEDAVLGETTAAKPGAPAGEFATALPGVGGGEAAFLAKPFTPKTLALKVREVLDRRAAARPDLLHRV
jgi:PAS domain S-box-containing protein